jgi:glyoxylase-like metal-dependent hydrolase (beta-lactamase superfamily II)
MPRALTITPNIWQVGGGDWGAPGDVPEVSIEGDANVYLLRLPDALVLVDCATVEGRAIIETNMRDVGVEPSDLTHLLLTHSHFDHTQAAVDWQADYNLDTYLNAVGVDFLQRGDLALVGLGICEPDYPFTPFTVHHPIQDDQQFSLGTTQFKTTYLPGHTPDSTLFIFELDGRRVGISGDITFCPKHDTGEIGWMNDLWHSNPRDYQRSLHHFLEIPLDLLLPGHGHPLHGQARIREAIALSLEVVDALVVGP